MEKKPVISICLSANRPKWWPYFIESCKGNKTPYEIIFVGDVKPDFELPPEAKWIYATVKPAQCYMIAIFHAQGDLITWSCDDADYGHPKNGLNCFNPLDIAYNHWLNMENRHGNDGKSVIALNPCEDGGFPQLNFHKFFGGIQSTPTFHNPVMAPMGLISRKFLLEDIKGYPNDAISGQAENSVVMSAYQLGGRLEICMDAKIYIHHRRSHPRDPNTGKEKNDFRKWYPEDRRALENRWVVEGYGAYEKMTHKEIQENIHISKEPLVPIIPFKFTDDIYTINQGPSGQW